MRTETLTWQDIIETDRGVGGAGNKETSCLEYYHALMPASSPGTKVFALISSLNSRCLRPPDTG